MIVLIVIIPVFFAVFRPEFLKMVDRVTDEGEALTPRTFRVYLGERNESEASDGFAGTNDLKLL